MNTAWHGPFNPLRCTNCRTPKRAGRPCPNPECAPPACPQCGRTPWHNQAICGGCGHDARTEMPPDRQDVR